MSYGLLMWYRYDTFLSKPKQLTSPLQVFAPQISCFGTILIRSRIVKISKCTKYSKLSVLQNEDPILMLILSNSNFVYLLVFLIGFRKGLNKFL